MIDLNKIEALAKAATQGEWEKDGNQVCPVADQNAALATFHLDADARYVAAANPAAVLELIDDRKRMASRLMICTGCGGQGDVYSGRTSYEGYNQPPEPIMHKCGECDGDGVLGDADECLSILDELEQLKAENEVLRNIVSESATACGAALSVDCSLEFMAMLPAEIGSVVGRLRKEAAQ